MMRLAVIAGLVVMTMLFTAFEEADACLRRRRAVTPCQSYLVLKCLQPSVTPSTKRDLTAEDARNALIVYLESKQPVVGPATLMNFRPNRDKLRDELRGGTFTDADGVQFISGFHISLAGKWYAIKMVGRGFFEDYRGEFVFEGNRWNARPPKLEAIGHFKDKDGIK
jgi:hypothetical protein